MTATKFLLIRHGQSTWNAAGRWQGHGDPPLSEQGCTQVESAAKHFADQSVDLLVCSDLLRARQTAAILGTPMGLQAKIEPRFREMDIGFWTGLSGEEIGKRWPEELRSFIEGDASIRLGDGESRLDLRTRAHEALEELRQTHHDQRVAIVTHLGVIRALMPNFLPENAEMSWLDGLPADSTSENQTRL